ncbi:unnamed protein product, partial [Polarella glacialis]
MPPPLQPWRALELSARQPRQVLRQASAGSTSASTHSVITSPPHHGKPQLRPESTSWATTALSDTLTAASAHGSAKEASPLKYFEQAEDGFGEAPRLPGDTRPVVSALSLPSNLRQVFRRKLFAGELQQVKRMLASPGAEGELRQLAAKEFAWALGVGGRVAGKSADCVDLPSALTACELQRSPRLNVIADLVTWNLKQDAKSAIESATGSLLGKTIVDRRRQPGLLGSSSCCQSGKAFRAGGLGGQPGSAGGARCFCLDERRRRGHCRSRRRLHSGHVGGAQAHEGGRERPLCAAAFPRVWQGCGVRGRCGRQNQEGACCSHAVLRGGAPEY